MTEDSRHYEIIVFDGCSTDSTPEIMANYKSSYDCIKYIKSAERRNIDVDLNEAVELASGEYIWTLSSDDVLVRGWLSIILKLIDDNQSDIYLMPAVHCSLDLEMQRKYPILKNGTLEISSYELKSFEDVPNYLSDVRTSEGLFSFCSSCLINRRRILATEPLFDANGTCWRYAARMIQVLMTFPVKISVSGIYVLHKRGDNDSFVADGYIRRLQIAIIEWTKAISLLKVPLNISNLMLRRVHSDIGFLSLLYVGQIVSSASDRSIYEECVRQRFSRPDFVSMLLIFTLLKMPRINMLRMFLAWGKKRLADIRARFYIA